MQAKRTISQTRRNLVVDAGIFVAFLVAGAPRLTGMAIHEWLGIAFGAAIVAHLLLHWQWLQAVTQRFFRRMPAATRLNYLLNAALFCAITAVIFSGLLISESALPLFGLELSVGREWRQIHGLAADLSVFIVGLHVALHWRWLLNALRTYVWKPGVSLIGGVGRGQAHGREAQS